MKTLTVLSCVALVLFASSCWNRNPNLSKDELIAELNREPDKSKETPVIPEGYVPPAGIKYTAKRDLSEPMVRLDVVAGLKNERPVKLSEFGKEVVYHRIGEFEYGVRLPFFPVEGGFLACNTDGLWLFNENFEKDRMLIKNDVEIQKNGNFVMSIPHNVVVNFCYDPAIRTLFCLLLNTSEDKKQSQRNVSLVSLDQLLSNPEAIEVKDIKNRVKLGHASAIHLVEGGFAVSGYYLQGLYTFDLKGDTMTHFVAGSEPFEEFKGTVRGAEGPDFYQYKGKTYYRQAYTDTVFRIKDVSHFQPVYKIDLGPHQATRSEGMKISFDLSDKYMVYRLMETDDWLFLGITQNYDCPANRTSKAVKFYQLLYNKQTKQLSSFACRDDLSKPGLIENDLDGGIGFWPQTQIDNKPYMMINGESLKKEVPKEKLDQIPALQGLKDKEIILITIK